MKEWQIGKKKSRQARWNRQLLLEKHNGRCVHCEEVVNLITDHPKSATIDHIVPISLGGLDSIRNMQLLCNACNNKKGNTHEIQT